MAFTTGTRVAWSHRLPSVYGAGATLKASVVTALDPQAVFGEVVGIENELGTHIRVKLDADADLRTLTPDDAGEVVLTSEELVIVAAEQEA